MTFTGHEPSEGYSTKRLLGRTARRSPVSETMIDPDLIVKEQKVKTRLQAVTGLTSIVAALLVSFVAFVAADGVGQENSWTIGVREVPAPAGASDELRESIRATPAPDVEASRWAEPKSDAEWTALIQQRDGAGGASLAALEEQFGVSIRRDTIEGVNVYYVTPAIVDPIHEGHLFLHVHGGGYVFSGGDRGVFEAVVAAARAKMPALSIDYRMPPDHPFPAAIDDVVTVYKHLLQKMSAKSIAIGGTSAGGGLALASVHKFKALDLDLPGAIYAGTPWADLTVTGDTLFTNEGLDRVLVTPGGLLTDAARLYAGGRDLKDPLISPVYGDFQGFPPTYLVTGTRDMFLSDTARTHRKLRAAGVIADLNVYEGMSHAGYLIVINSPESAMVFEEMNAFFQKHLE